MVTQTLTRPKQNQSAEDKVRQLRQAFADAPEFVQHFPSSELEPSPLTPRVAPTVTGVPTGGLAATESATPDRETSMILAMYSLPPGKVSVVCGLRAGMRSWRRSSGIPRS